MFSKEMEALIEATLQDGVLTDQEKAVLLKRAQKEGIDVDELDVYIQSLLQKRQQEQIEKRNQQEEELEKEKAKAIGPVCPKCGKQVAPLTLKCDCGYEFTTSKSVSSAQVLFDKLSSVRLSSSEEGEIASAAPMEQNAKRQNFLTNKKIDIISVFPVPNTKEDIIEFLALSIPSANKKISVFDRKKTWYVIAFLCGIIFPIFGWVFGAMFISARSFAEEKLKKTWVAKCEQVLIKGRSLRGDPEFTQQLDYYENLLDSNEKTTGGMMDNLNVDYKKVGKISLFIIGAFIVLFLLVKLFSGISKGNNDNSDGDIDNVENIINGAYNDNIGETDDTENVSGGASDASDEMLKAQEEAAEQMRKAQEEAAEQMRKAQEEMRKAMGQ